MKEINYNCRMLEQRASNELKLKVQNVFPSNLEVANGVVEGGTLEVRKEIQLSSKVLILRTISIAFR